LLSGRLLRNGGGAYVLVSGFIEAAAGSGRMARFEVSPQATARMREECARAHPTADVVGWWHSHLGPSHYSDIDVTSQSVWRQPQSVGLLVFAAGDPWATVYLGPDSRHLGYPVATLPAQTAAAPTPAAAATPAAALADGRAGADGHAGPLTAPAAVTVPRRSHSGLSQRQQGLIRLAALIATLAALFALAALVVIYAQIRNGLGVLSSQLSSDQHGLVTQIKNGHVVAGGELRKALAAGTVPSISSACTPAPPPAAANAYRCTARVSGAHGTIEWQLDGKREGTSRTVTIAVPRDGQAYRIRALFITPAGTYRGLAQDILLPAAPSASPAAPASPTSAARASG